jgi:hypothetical protein
MNAPKLTQAAQDLDTRMARFGRQIAAGLTVQSESLPADVSERLRFAREQAMLKARNARVVQTAPVRTVQVQPDGSLTLAGPSPKGSRWLKAASIVPLLVLVLGLLAIQHSQWYQQIKATADLDAALLTDKLPPAAYGDPGFSEYLSDEEDASNPAKDE